MRADGRAAQPIVPDGARTRRFGVGAQLYALRRAAEQGSSDQGIGDFTTLALLGEAAGRAGAATLGVSPLHMLFPRDRERASPYHPSDRRFLDPILIDALDRRRPARDEALRTTLAPRAGDAIANMSGASSVDYARSGG